MIESPRHQSRRRVRAIAGALLGLVLAVLVVAPPAADAAGNESWAVEPSGPEGPGSRDFFVYTLKPGQGIQDTVGVSNFTSQPLTFKIYARDAFSSPGDGGFGVEAESVQPVDAAAWVRLPDEVQEYTIEAGTRADIPFALTVPPDAEPGDHAGAIVAALQTPPQQAQDGTGLNVEQRIASRVYVRVEGPFEPALAVNQVSVDYDNTAFALFGGRTAVVSYEVENIGNLRLSPQIQIKLKDPLGRTVKTSPFRNYDDLLPGGNLVLTETFEGVPPVGLLTAEVTAATFGENATSVTRSGSTWAIPWVLVVAAVIVLALLVRWWMLRQRKASPPAAPPTTPERPREPVHS